MTKRLEKYRINRRDCIKAAFAGAFALCGAPFSASATDYREAKYWTAEGNRAFCELCPNECIVLDGKAGDCRVRVNKGGKLQTIAYGNPCAVNVDPIEKKPLFHFLPATRAFSIATAGCNLSCLNCQNWSISQTSPAETRNYDMPPDAVVATARKYSCKTIAYTYSEPTVFYEYMLDTAKIARRRGLKNLYITAAYIKEKPLLELCEYLDAANVDLKSFDDKIYKKLNAGSLQPVLDALKIMKEKKVWLEITNLVVPGWTDDIKMIERMCEWLVKNGFSEYPLHFSRFSPMYKLKTLPPTPLETLRKAREAAGSAGMKYVYIGNVANAGAEDTNCPKCDKTVVKRRGFAVLENNISGGKCSFCGYKIAGVWQ